MNENRYNHDHNVVDLVTQKGGLREAGRPSGDDTQGDKKRFTGDSLVINNS